MYGRGSGKDCRTQTQVLNNLSEQLDRGPQQDEEQLQRESVPGHILVPLDQPPRKSMFKYFFE